LPSNFNVSDDATAGVVKDDDRMAAGHLKALFLLTARAGTGLAKLFVGNRQRKSEGLRFARDASTALALMVTQRSKGE
jgi:hypothetical protein